MGGGGAGGGAGAASSKKNLCWAFSGDGSSKPGSCTKGDNCEFVHAEYTEEPTKAPSTMEFPLVVAGAKVSVVVTNEPTVENEWLESNVLARARGGPVMLGFDAEWRPASRKNQHPPVSLIQLYARDSRAVLVTHVGEYRAGGGDDLHALIGQEELQVVDALVAAAD